MSVTFVETHHIICYWIQLGFELFEWLCSCYNSLCIKLTYLPSCLTPEEASQLQYPCPSPVLPTVECASDHGGNMASFSM